ncbi:MAG: ATP-dependent serine peptidase containing a domain protein [Microbacteriaceae bacterium]|nr:ATP-dependent serine peptidase containing a domain protein [Microbacteriaceae bacterium]
MALFTDDRLDPKPRRRIAWIGWTLLIAALIGTFAFATVPAPYVIEQPGPVFNTLGKVSFQHKEVPLIDIPGQKTYPTKGTLDMLTVSVVGSREQSPSWFEVAQAWLDPSKAVLPLDYVYPKGESVQQSNQQGTVDMQNSQKDAIAAALTKLGYTLPSTLTVGGFSPKSPSAGILKDGDTIVSVNGQTANTVLGLRAIIAKAGAGTPVAVDIVRAGKPQTVQVTPVLSTDPKPAPIIGIFPAITYSFPFEVKIQLENVGGPSAGQMFALGIIDKLSPGELNGGAKVAGTGTIDAAGDVGGIGGIRQKMYGAVDAGATWFLAPYSNCDEVTGHVPHGLTVLAVKTLDDSLAALKAISTKADTSGLLSCPAG